MMFMRPTLTLVLAVATFAASAAVARADTFPVSGRFGISNWTVKGAIDCANLRVINFAGEQRTDSDGGVPSYRNNWVRREGEGRYRVSDWFTTGQIRNGQMFYELRVVDPDRIEMIQQRGGTLRLQRCK
jgi:hypothetical protein